MNIPPHIKLNHYTQFVSACIILTLSILDTQLIYRFTYIFGNSNLYHFYFWSTKFKFTYFSATILKMIFLVPLYKINNLKHPKINIFFMERN